MQESREYIKSRMLKNAARAWGLSDAESENNFDPLISMLLTACSIELEKISGEIESSRARVLEKMVQLLSPDTFTGALPSHSIATATPLEKKEQLAENTQFYFSMKLQDDPDEETAAEFKDVYFTPTASFNLNRATIRFMATGTRLYKMTNSLTKELVAQCDPGKDLPPCSLWLAIDEPQVPLQDTTFYFDLRNDANKQLFYHQLPKANWYWDERAIPHEAGYGNRTISGEQMDLKNIIQREDDISGKIKKHINAFYKSSFITLTDPSNLCTGKGNEILMQMINEVFTGKAAEVLKPYKLRWICVDFPQTINSNILKDLVCAMNCFPVFNRRAHDFTYRMQDVVNVIPLQTEDIFLNLEEVTNDDGKVLNMRTFQRKDDDGVSILLRNGGVGRFDERDAAAMVDYLIQLLRDESAAFSAIGNDFMNSEMKQLQQIINKLEQRVFSTKLRREQTPYLIIRNNPKNPWKNIFIRYWSTAGKTSNFIKAGSYLMQYKGSSFENGRVQLMSTTMGGTNKSDKAESVLAFKSALLSRDRLITSEDIRAFCFYQLGEKAKKIDIEKGVMIHPDQRKGFMKTIDIIIVIRVRDYELMLENGEINFWTDNLKLQIEEKSAGLLPYRVFINKDV